MLKFPALLLVHPPSGGLGSRAQRWEAVAENVDGWKGRLYARNWLSLLRFLVSTQTIRMQNIISIDVSVKRCSFFTLFAAFIVSFRFVLAGPTAPATASARHQLATIVFPLPLLKQCVFLHSYNCATHRWFHWSIFKSLSTNYFFYPYRPLSFALLQHSSMSADNQLGDHGDLCSHFFQRYCEYSTYKSSLISIFYTWCGSW